MLRCASHTLCLLRQGAIPFLPYAKEQIDDAARSIGYMLSAKLATAKEAAVGLAEELQDLDVHLTPVSSMATLRSKWPVEHQTAMLELDDVKERVIKARIQVAQAAYDGQIALIGQLHLEQQKLQHLTSDVPDNKSINTSVV